MPDLAWETSDFVVNRARARPFLKWAGGKGQLLGQLRRFIPVPVDGSTYFEPFLGAGAVFFSLKPSRAVLSDINRPLVETFLTVRNRLSQLVSELGELPPRPSRDDYYTLRQEYNLLVPELSKLSAPDMTRLAALFIWLNHTCYNGLYRVNRLGLFNVPFGSVSDPSIFDPGGLKRASRALRSEHVEIHWSDYGEILSRARSGDVAYLDPPYDASSGTSSFTSYTQEDFGHFDQEALAATVRTLIERGCRIVLTNAPTPKTRRLFHGLQIHSVDARRAINCKGTGRGKVKELVVIG